jgi:hypothetical protein
MNQSYRASVKNARPLRESLWKRLDDGHGRLADIGVKQTSMNGPDLII